MPRPPEASIGGTEFVFEDDANIWGGSGWEDKKLVYNNWPKTAVELGDNLWWNDCECYLALD